VELLSKIDRNRKWITLFIDLKGAYDSVFRDVLLQIFRRRIKDGWAAHLLEDLLKPNKIWIGNNSFTANTGVPQGSTISPLLFNMYLDEAIKKAWQ